jgi:hypothetical protein
MLFRLTKKEAAVLLTEPAKVIDDRLLEGNGSAHLTIMIQERSLGQ